MEKKREGIRLGIYYIMIGGYFRVDSFSDLCGWIEGWLVLLRRWVIKMLYLEIGGFDMDLVFVV